MNRKLLFHLIVAKSVILLATAACSTPLASSSGTGSSQQDKFPEFSWDHIPRYMHIYKRTDFTDEELKYLAGFPLITFEKAQGTANGSVQEGTLKVAREVKKCNPYTKILYYKNVVIDWTGSAASKELETINGYLQGQDGSYPVVNQNSKCRFFDISRPEVREWWMKDASRMLSDSSIDGIFIDANIKVLVDSYFADSKKTGDLKSQQLKNGYFKLLGEVNEKLRPDKIILANIIRARLKHGGLEHLNYFDGSYLEAFEHNVGGVSRTEYIAKGIECTRQAARQGRIIAFTAGLGEALDKDSSGIGLDEAREGITNLETINERLDYLTAIFLVIAEKYSYFYPHDGYAVRENTRGTQINRLWMKKLPVFEKRLGPPKGPATKKGYIYTREFEHCSVWLDIENEDGKLNWR